MAFVSGTIFGFASIFSVLGEYGIYSSYCTSVISLNSTTSTNSIAVSERKCDSQTKKYQVCEQNFITDAHRLIDS